MQLFGTPTSPYVRKVRATAIALGMADQITFTVVDAHKPTPEFLTLNPLSKVPVLVKEDGAALYDSSVICEYLNEAFGQGRLLPSAPETRAERRVVTTLADGILDAGILVRMENMRPAEERSPAWIEKQTALMHRGMDHLNANVDTLGAEADLATIAVACAISWTLLRHDQQDWFANRSSINRWYQQFSALDCMTATAP